MYNFQQIKLLIRRINEVKQNKKTNDNINISSKISLCTVFLFLTMIIN